MLRLLQITTNLFPVWVVLCGALALVHPPLFTWFKGPAIVWGLGVIMLGMGLTLSLEDFKRALRMPRAVALGVASQFTVMPLLGWGIARGMQLEAELAVGLILVACCPGGTASNVVAYLARANVALSVLMTMSSTFAAILLTPLLTKLLASTYVRVDAWALFLDMVKVVLLPVVAGISLNHLAPRLVRRVLPIAPLVSVAVIVLIVASILGQKADAVKASAGVLLTAVFLLHAGGFALGYLTGKIFRYDAAVCRTVSIEVGMQNSGLGAVLARENFPQMPLAPTPCVISAVYHCVIGSALAAWWRTRPTTTPAIEPAATSRPV